MIELPLSFLTSLEKSLVEIFRIATNLSIIYFSEPMWTDLIGLTISTLDFVNVYVFDIKPFDILGRYSNRVAYECLFTRIV